MYPTKICHIITGLDTGGAQTMLYNLLSSMNRRLFESQVISLVHLGPVGEKIQALGIPVRTLNMQHGIPNPISVIKLGYWLRHDCPDIIQTWMYHADLIGGLAAKIGQNIPVAWGVQHSNFEAKNASKMTMWTVKACALLSSRLSNCIVYCSEASRRTHSKIGYSSKKTKVIPNSSDINVYKPDTEARLAVRQELNIPDDVPLIGLMARFNPQKDHRNFIRAAAQLHTDVPECHFLLCGDGITYDNPTLAGWIQAVGMEHRFHLLGRRADMPRLTAALDIASTSASFGEGLPLVISEAMACGVPCVVTDVGDSAIVVGETGIVVPPKDPQALANGWQKLLVDMTIEERQQLGILARQRISDKFSLNAVVTQYEALYQEMLVSKHSGLGQKVSEVS